MSSFFFVIGVIVSGVGYTYIVEVDVGAAVVGEDEVADGVGALDGVAVVLEGVEEPGILRGDEVFRALIRP